MRAGPRTEMLLRPSLEECVKAAVALDMPEIEGREFFYHYQANGWLVGRVPMKSFSGAMGGWHVRWIKKGSPGTPSSNGKHHPAGNGVMSGADKVIRGEEYRRVLDRIKAIRDTYGDHQNWRQTDIVRYKELIERRNQLRSELGIKV